ncbi:hypothetical protein AU210_012406 [Fusarium oxysporum f. sp. radicis-cucumerinum]|uniref:Endonuclease/exonuclease/phosphatase domain-containing protein n=1 Tax=Fusarium oxysporum f. sp. radicis-cucumerinum TaxID=327505 RepID=A0A2H3GNP8_FUSOX|nr:hypothetical protein AU210_012406 [Fusarium oxysporum f. sp. radicis-cucumerinum]
MRTQGWGSEGGNGWLWEVMTGMEYLLEHLEDRKLFHHAVPDEAGGQDTNSQAELARGRPDLLRVIKYLKYDPGFDLFDLRAALNVRSAGATILPATVTDSQFADAVCVNCLGPHQANFHIPTNPYGNTIDLAFTNLPLAEAIVEDHLATSSDHFTLSLTFPDVRSTPVQPGKIRVTTEDELKRFVEIVELGATGIPLADSTPEELDELASSLVSLLTSAAKASGRPVRKGGRPAPWWTEECADAAAAFRAVRRSYPLGFNQDVQIAKRDFHRVVRRAKRRYWRNLIDGFSSSSDVFKAVRWLKSPGAFQPPPLQVDNVVYESQMDKANALRQATLERRTAEDDIANAWTPRSTPNQLCAGLASGWTADYRSEFMSRSGRLKRRQWPTIYEASLTRYTALCRAPFEVPSEHVSSQYCFTAPRRGTWAGPGHVGTSPRRTYHPVISTSYK